MAVKCKFYQLQSVEESIATTGKDCAVMSKPNANSGYWQMPLDEPSHLLCTFITPYGRYCPTRGPFGYHPCQKYLVRDWTKRFIVGVARSMDDFLIYGKNTDKHDERMNKFLNRMSEE